MSNPSLTAAFWDYDRTRPLADGRVAIEGYELRAEYSAPEATFRRALAAEFDISELSLSNSVTALSRGSLPYTLIPVFLSRAFRHSMIYVRTDRGIEQPRDLRGKTVGVQEYDMTAAVVVRGFLRDQFDVLPEQVLWKVGEVGGGVMPTFAGPPPKASIEVFPPGASLEERLLSGQLDAILALRPSPALTSPGSGVVRLFADARAVEQQWFAASGHFPIMHVVGLHHDVVQRDPGLPAKTFQAFLEAKQMAVHELEVTQALKVTLPWPQAAVAEARAILGQDYWPYGVGANRATLEAQLRWSWLDGLQAVQLEVEHLFPGFS